MDIDNKYNDKGVGVNQNVSAEDSEKIKKELDELKRAKAEIENLEKKLKSEQELLLKKRLEEERITQLKEAEKQRQLYEQRLAEERKRRRKGAWAF